MDEILARAHAAWPATAALLRRLVECESPSDSPASVARFMDLLAAEAAGCAASRLFRGRRYGPCLLLNFHLPGPRRRKSGRLLAIGHGDTVWPLGTLQSMPWRECHGRLSGPGVFDMKAGLAFFLAAMRILGELDRPVARHVALWVVSDEETGSQESRPRTEALARQSSAVLVLEPASGLDGRLKTARKGVGDYLIRVTGQAAHSGVDFSSGASAIVELARQIERLAAFTNLKKGITVNPGVISGGTRPNVVAASACAGIDVRIARLRDAAPLHRKLMRLAPFDPRCRIQVAGGLNRPPMERTPAIASLFHTARSIARRRLGLALEESSTGGGSDGNFTAALGIPTLDGLGAVGQGAHAPSESILIAPSPARIALLAHLVHHLGQ